MNAEAKTKRWKELHALNHYDWLDKHFSTFTKSLGLGEELNGLISAHGDKCYQYRNLWEAHDVPFFHGVAIYLLSYVYPYANEVRETDKGWVAPDGWVITNYHRFKEHLASVEE